MPTKKVYQKGGTKKSKIAYQKKAKMPLSSEATLTLSFKWQRRLLKLIPMKIDSSNDNKTVFENFWNFVLWQIFHQMLRWKQRSFEFVSCNSTSTVRTMPQNISATTFPKAVQLWIVKKSTTRATVEISPQSKLFFGMSFCPKVIQTLCPMIISRTRFGTRYKPLQAQYRDHWPLKRF